MNNLKKIYTTLPNGTKIEYQVILTTINPLTNKHYVVYTDNTIDKNNTTNLIPIVLYEYITSKSL